MKPRILHAARLSMPLAVALAALFARQAAKAQQFWNTNGTGAVINTANWGSSAAGPFTNAFTANGDIVFTAGSALTGATVDVGNITVADGVTVTFTAGGTLGTGGNVRTLDVGSGSILNLAGQALSVAAGTGFIKNGAGTLISSNGNQYGGGFTLNAGTVAVGGVNAMGGAAGNTLTINGGTIRSNGTNARDLSGKYTGGITIGGNFTLGDSVNNGNLIFNNAVSLGAATRTITANSNATISGAISGATGVGLTKEGSGNLTLSGANSFTGAVQLNAGSLIVGGATYPALGGNSPGTNGPASVTIAAGATLNFQQAGTGATTANYYTPLTFNGGNALTSGGSGANTQALTLHGSLTLGANANLLINGNSTLIIPAANSVDLGGNTLTIQTDGSLAGNNVAAAIGGTGGSIVKAGGNLLTFSGANTFSGSTTVGSGTLALNYATQNNSKLSDTAVLTLSGGTVSLTGASGSHTEIVGSTTLRTGSASSITRSGANTAVLQLGTITVNTGSLNFGAAGIATTDNLNNTLGILGPWATVAGNSWAVNSTNAVNGLITEATYTDVTRLDSGTKTISGGPGHVRIIEGTGVAGDITLAAAGTTAIDTLVNAATTAGNLDIGAGNTLSTSAILQGSVAGALTIGLPATPGSLSALSAGGDLAVTTLSGMSIASTITDNTSASTLTKYGTGTLNLTGNNTYSGVTTINGGSLVVHHENALGSTAGGTVVQGGTFAANTFLGINLALSSTTSITLPENISLSGNTAGRASVINDNAQSHTLAGGIDVTSDTSLAAIWSNGAGSVTVTGDISGTLSSGASFVIRGNSTNSQNRLLGSVNITGGNFSKTDAGTWLVGASGETYSWPLTSVANGTLRMGAAGVLPSSAPLQMGGTGTLDLNGFSQTTSGITYDTGTGTRTITNSDTVNPAVFTVNNATNFSPSGGAAPTVNSVILTGNLGLTKQGAGTLTLGGTNTYTGVTTVSGGTLAMVSNLIANSSGIVIGDGATLQSTNNFVLAANQSVTGTGATGSLTIQTPGSNGFVTSGNNLFNTSGTMAISRLDVRGTGNRLDSGSFQAGGAASFQRGLLVGNTVAGELTIAAGASLTTLGSGSGAQDILGNSATGNGTLIIDGGSYTATAGLGTLLLGNATNAGGGTLTVNSGSAAIGTLGYQVGSTQSGIVNLNGGTLTIANITSNGSGTREFHFDGGQFIASGAVVFPSDLTTTVKNGGAQVDTGSNAVAISSALAGAGTGGLIKTGSGTLTLSASNTYTGATAVNAGTLVLTGASQATSGFTFSGGGKLGLDIASSVTAASATVDFTGQSVLVTGTPTLASYTLLTAASMTGTPTLAAPAPAGYELKVESNSLKLVQSGYASWAAVNGAGPNLQDDHDGDGVENGVEYLLGGTSGNTTGFTALPGVVENLGVYSVTWTKGSGYSGVYSTDFVVESSTTLTGPWTVETIPGNVVDSPTEVKYTFPGPLSGKRFVRLKVTGP